MMRPEASRIETINSWSLDISDCQPIFKTSHCYLAYMYAVANSSVRLCTEIATLYQFIQKLYHNNLQVPVIMTRRVDGIDYYYYNSLLCQWLWDQVTL